MRLVNWTNWIFGVILLVLNFSGNLCLGQNDVKSGESVALREAKVARESAEKRALDLELELEKLRRENQNLRSKYAELFLETHRSVDNLKDLEKRVVNLLQSKNDGSISDENIALQALNLIVGQLIKVQDARQKYEETISTLMEVLHPSEALKGELDKAGNNLKIAVDDTLATLSAVARHDSDNSNAKCSIIDIKEDIGLVVLDKGSLAGVKNAGKWKCIGIDGNVLARFTTVEVRPEMSGALILEGNIQTVRRGMALVAD